MAFGFTPKHVENLHVENVSQHQFLTLALQAATSLDWQIIYKSASGFIALTSKSMFKWKAKVTVTIDQDTAQLQSESTGNELFDLGKNKKAIQRFTTAFSILLEHFNAAALDQEYSAFEAELVPADSDKLIQPPPSGTKIMAPLLALFTPRTGYYITPVILDLNILIYLLMVISGAGFLLPDNESLLSWGANFRPATLDGEWWRLLTNCFIHIGILHLALNMYALLYIGLLLEPILGRSKFAVAYLSTGILASITSLAWHDLTISAGASGAIFGMYGVFLALLTTNCIDKSTRKALLTSIAIFVGYNLLNGMKGGIDNAAHIGGLISGLIIGYGFYPTLIKPDSRKLETGMLISVSLLSVLVAFFVYTNIPNDIPKFDAKMRSLSALESTALAVYRLPKNTAKEDYLIAVKDSGILNWNKTIVLLDSVKRLKLPAPLVEKTGILRDYCIARLNCYQLMYKAIDENTAAYTDSIQFYNTRIGDLLEKLKVP